MRLEEVEKIELLLSLKQTIDNLRDSLRKQGVNGDVKSASITISDNGQAILTGDGFEITPITADILPISSQETTTWQWDVRPLRSGTLHLHVVVNAMVDLNDRLGFRPHMINSYDQTYQVAVPWGKGAVATFCKNNLQWLWIVVVAPGGLWCWSFLRKKRNKAGFV